jgi:hypothetical protein
MLAFKNYKDISEIKSVEELVEIHNSRIIHMAYQFLLSREVDDGGYMNWKNYLDGGGSVDHMLNEFIGSDEAYALRNNLEVFKKSIFEEIHSSSIVGLRGHAKEYGNKILMKYRKI